MVSNRQFLGKVLIQNLTIPFVTKRFFRLKGSGLPCKRLFVGIEAIMINPVLTKIKICGTI
jgi:hypothetical protein